MSSDPISIHRRWSCSGELGSAHADGDVGCHADVIYFDTSILGYTLGDICYLVEKSVYCVKENAYGRGRAPSS